MVKPKNTNVNSAAAENPDNNSEKTSITFLDGRKIEVSKQLDNSSSGNKKPAKSQGSGAYIATDGKFFYKVLPWTETENVDREEEINSIYKEKNSIVVTGNSELVDAVRLEKEGFPLTYKQAKLVRFEKDGKKIDTRVVMIMDYYGEESRAGKFQLSRKNVASIYDHITAYATNAHVLNRIKNIFTMAGNINLKDPQGFTLNNEKTPMVFFDTQLGEESGSSGEFEKFIKYVDDVREHSADIVLMDAEYYKKNSEKISSAEASIVVQRGEKEYAWEVHGKLFDYLDIDSDGLNDESNGAVGGVPLFSNEQIKEAAKKLTEKLTEKNSVNVLVIPTDGKTERKAISVSIIKEIFESIEGVSVKSPRLLGGDESLGDLMTRLTATSAARNPPSKYLNLEDANEFIRKVFDEKGQLLRSTNDNLDVDIIKRVILFSNDRLSSDLASSFDSPLSDLLNSATNLNPDQLTEIKVFRETSRLNAPDFDTHTAESRVNVIVVDEAYAQVNLDGLTGWQSEIPERVVLIRKNKDLWNLIGQLPVEEPGGAAAPGHTTEEIKKAVASVMEKQKLYFGVVKSNNPSSKVNYEIVSESFGVRDIKAISGLLGGGNTDKKIIGQVFIDKKWRDVKESDWPNWAYQIGDEPRLTFSNKANFVWLEKQENGVAVKFASDEIKEAFENLYKDWHAGKINLLRGVSANHFSWDEIVRDGIIRSDGPNDSPRATMSTEKTTAPKPKNPKKIMDTEAPEGRFWAEDGTRWLPTDVDTPKNREVVEGIAKGNLADYTGEVKNALINNSPDILAGMVLNIEAGKDSKLNICMVTAGEIVVQGPIKKILEFFGIENRTSKLIR